ncbi:MAG: hypothetical protein M9955_11795 [Rhizobiaceae bacterium]|nr:hypothetical protein [Rhizobiaceae bacterium]
MTHLANLLAVLLGVGFGVMMNTLPDYNSSFQPFGVGADENGVGRGRLFTAKLAGLSSAGEISYPAFGADIVRDTSATFLVAEISIAARKESRQVEAIWLGATGRQYSQTVRIENAPRDLPTAWFQPGLEDRVRAVFELPEDEIAGGALVLMAQGDPILDSAVRLPAPAAPPEKQDMLRLEP